MRIRCRVLTVEGDATILRPGVGGLRVSLAETVVAWGISPSPGQEGSDMHAVQPTILTSLGIQIAHYMVKWQKFCSTRRVCAL